MTFPSHFKELNDIYGSAIFFDNYSILWPHPASYKTLESFLEAVRDGLNRLVEYEVEDEDMNPIPTPKLYPEKGGLFPFMCDFSGGKYFWNTESDDPDKWPILCLTREQMLFPQKFSSLAELFLDVIEQYKARPTLHHRIRVDRDSPPTS